MKQDACGGNPFERHLCGFKADFFRSRAYTVVPYRVISLKSPLYPSLLAFKQIQERED